jgi:hypothetical protein
MRRLNWAIPPLLFLSLPGIFFAQTSTAPVLDEILQRLETNLDHYDSSVPSFFCDEHAVSQVVPGMRNQNTVTDSVFRLKRVVNRDHTSTLDESREVKSVNGHPATAKDIAGPTILSGAFEGALAVVSQSQRVCMNYSLERHRPNAPYVIRFSSLITPQNSAACLLQEEGKGRALIDPATMQITRLELTTPHHTIDPGGRYYEATMGDRVLSVDYAPVQLDGQTFWMPSNITSTVTTGHGTFHAIVWTFKATYRNFHKLEVTSRILPATNP